MSKAGVVYENLADDGSITASSWIASAPPAMMQNPHISRRWKGRAGASEFIILDLLASASISSLALLGLEAVVADTQGPMTLLATSHIRISLTDPTGLTGEVYDSGSAAGRISPKYSALIQHWATPITGRYIRIDLSQTDASALLAGRFVVGLRHNFAINFSYGWGMGYTDLSRVVKSAGGQTFVDADDKFRVLNLSFGVLDEADRYDFVDEMDRLNGISQDVLFTLNPASATPDRDTIWGLMQDLNPPTQPSVAHFTKSYSVAERR